MTVTIEITARDFYNECWSGAEDTLEELTYDEIEKVFNILDEALTGEPMSLTELNDFFWFERDTIAEWLGYSDFDELMHRNDEEDEEEVE